MKIHEFFENISDESVMLTEKELVSSERIKEATMRKIQGKKTTNSRKYIWGKIASIAAAVLLVATIGGGTAYAALGVGSMSEFLAQIGKVFPVFSVGATSDNQTLDQIISDYTDSEGNAFAVEDNGTKVVAENAIFDGHTLIMKLLVEAPSDVTFTELAAGDFYSVSDVDTASKMFPGYEYGFSGGADLEGAKLYTVSSPADNKMEIIVIYDFDVEAGQIAAPETFHFEGIWANEVTKNPNAESKDDEYYYKETKLLSGDFNIPLTGINKSKEVVFETELGEVDVTSISYYFNDNTSFTYEQIQEIIDNNKTCSITLSDGTVVKDADGDGFWDQIVDTKDIVSFSIGEKTFTKK